MTHTKLGDVADVKISGVDKKTQPGEDTVRLCNYTDIYYNWAITKEMYGGLMVASAKASEINDYSVGKGMVVITKDSETREDIGHSAYVADDFCDVVLGYHCAFVKPHKGELDGSFLNGLLRSSYAAKYFANNAGGSGQRYYLNEDAIKGLPLFLPSFKEQCLIGKFLSSIDRKIALNRKKIEKLEALAKTIYDYWFVQFDFPDANGRPYKSSGGKMVYNPILKREIPVGWEVKRLGDCIGGVPKTKRVPTKEYLSRGNIPIIDQEVGSYIVGYTNDEDARLKIESCVVFGDHSCAVKYVNFDFARGADGTQIINSLIPKQLDNLQIYLYLKTTQFDAGYKRHFYDLKQRCVTVSNEVDLVARFQNVSRDAFSLIKELTIANLRLNSLRDFLLPLLMNGQVEIGE